MGRRGFTLIELLVVIAIIAILAAILFPVFISAKQKAKQSTCTSNMKQITMSLLLYTQDTQGRAPLYWDGVTPTGSDIWDNHYWCCGAIRRYFAGERLMLARALRCPSYKGDQWVYMSSMQYPGLKEISGKASLGILGLPAEAYGAENACPGRSLDSLRRNQALLIEGKGRGIHSYWADPFANSVMESPTYVIGPGDRHNQGCNLSFPDGHVKWIRQADAISHNQWPILAGQVGP
jgi:prepilin-type N-terminal cleavage/methylation domain-containing protein/prepilin-type processing-associated H-X9-DG protein